MKILAIDCSAGAASACVWQDGKVLGECYTNVKLTHSQTLMPMLCGILEYAKVELPQIDVFAVTAGPGSFTGVRIGVASVKGMAFAQGKPCAGVSTLEAMAENLRVLDCTACCVMDARCGQVYNAMFAVKNGVVHRLTPDRALSIEELAQECAGCSTPVVLVGDGAQLCAESAAFAAVDVRLAPEPIRFQRACGAAVCAARAAEAGKLLSAEELLPVYLRPPQAQRSLKRKH
ncbi:MULTISPECIES: tRNA (adenosine(37)-N6)-threonylcarbamoyltransferase complex dimerization subunit type 1 TsaB [Caproicibacterium]|uniref:tRNA (Adenosine(37)-N6)-threonylcarbamoyltransferase complex dimerization subunit type 1 TsaB n=1 Tax=Caproicibacterium argilliputei TaxID=3030016 RepID=A0AA97DBC6_9FIRM|nr:tRNA (adenosine(37)-N6)-threonylcarbamoyltransferase complex dimerization subunit type 1 TsaB [Caproicibacterium argilliputei]WOC33294.1 tRNA (adenosine(37)-N6)-threonylcarbamoyltransferase complex dimerization subunit type 1 TsaB [Caproicibacterium argilliputei]